MNRLRYLAGVIGSALLSGMVTTGAALTCQPVQFRSVRRLELPPADRS